MMFDSFRTLGEVAGLPDVEFGRQMSLLYLLRAMAAVAKRSDENNSIVGLFMNE